jgi:rare lipoprotein A (peptidoglycan hydrolase)
MRISHGLAAMALCIPLGLPALIDPAFGQSFDERWSIVPKANAEPAPQESQVPPPDSQPGTNSVTSGQGEARAPIPPAKPAAGTKPVAGKKTPAASRVFTGAASFYSYAGGKTASGMPYRRDALTAAHRTLAFGTRVRVTDVKTKKSVEVVVTDRGPAIRKRVLDLSLGAAQVLGIGGRGVIQVRAEVIGQAPILGKGS